MNFSGRKDDCLHRGGSRMFFRRGYTRLLLYFNTNKPHSFFLQNTSCIRKPQVISGGEGAHPVHPPPRSAPVATKEFLTSLFVLIAAFVTFLVSFIFTAPGCSLLASLKRKKEWLMVGFHSTSLSCVYADNK